MITPLKQESLSRRGQTELIAVDGQPGYNPWTHEHDESTRTRLHSVVDSPPGYDDPNYIPSPISYASASSGHEGVPDGGVAVSEFGMASRPDREDDLEKERRDALHGLEKNMAALQAARARASHPKQQQQVNAEEERRVVELEETVLENMCRLAILQPNAHLRAEWRARAETFMRTMRSFRHLGPRSRLCIERAGEDGEDMSCVPMVPSEPPAVHTSTGIKDGDELEFELRAKDSGSAQSPAQSHSLTLSKRAKRMYTQMKNDRGAVLIAKGSAGIVVLHCAAPVVLIGVSVYIVYGVGKGVAHLGKRVVDATTTRKGCKDRPRDEDAAVPPPSPPVLETRSIPPRPGKLRRKN